MKRLSLFFLLLTSVYSVKGQDDLLNELEKSDTSVNNYTFATFKSTRIINGQSVETKRRGKFSTLTKKIIA